MSRGLTVYSKHDVKSEGGLVYVVSEFNTDNDETKEVARSSNLADLLGKVPKLEMDGGYDGGVVIDLTSPV